MGGRVEALLDDALCGGDREIGELLAELGDGGVTLELDLAAGAFEQVFGLGAGGLPRLFLDTGRDLLRLGHELLPFLPRLVQLARDLLLGLGEALLGFVRGLEPLLDAALALVEGRGTGTS